MVGEQPHHRCCPPHHCCYLQLQLLLPAWSALCGRWQLLLYQQWLVKKFGDCDCWPLVATLAEMATTWGWLRLLLLQLPLQLLLRLQLEQLHSGLLLRLLQHELSIEDGAGAGVVLVKVQALLVLSWSDACVVLMNCLCWAGTYCLRVQDPCCCG